MLDIQSAVLEILDASLKSLKKMNPGLDLHEINAENGLFASFEVLLRQQLDPIWHQTSQKTRSLMHDIKVMTKLLRCEFSLSLFLGVKWGGLMFLFLFAFFFL